MAINLGQPINWGHPLTRGLLSRWLCIGNPWSAGLTLRDLCRHNNGTLISGCSFEGGRTNGRQSVRLAATSINDRVESVATGLPVGASAEFTIAYWHYTFTYVSLSTDFGFGLQMPNTGGVGQNRCSLQFNNNYYLWGGAADFDTGISYITGSWNHVCFSATASNVYFYLNGKQRASAARPSYGTADGYLSIGGAHSAAATNTNAKIDDGCIWTRALSDADVAQWYENTLIMRDPTLNWYRAGFITTPPAAPSGLAANPLYGGGAAASPLWGYVA